MIVHFTGIISSCEAIALSNYIDTQCVTFLKFPITREVIEQFIAQLWNQFQLNVWRIGIDAAVRCSPGCQNPDPKSPFSTAPVRTPCLLRQFPIPTFSESNPKSQILLAFAFCLLLYQNLANSPSNAKMVKSRTI